MIRHELILGMLLLVVASCGASPNFLGEIFNDLRFGDVPDVYRQKLETIKPRCLQGSHHFNGSCYFISNVKYATAMASASGNDADVLVETLMRSLKRNNKLTSSRLFDASPIGMAAELAAMPGETVWNNAYQLCTQLNNDSTLLYFNNYNMEEYDYVISLLTRLNFPNLVYLSSGSGGGGASGAGETRDLGSYNQEKKYFVGLKYNNSAWQWLNGVNLSESLMERFGMEKARSDSYRRCAYLNLRDNGEVKIEATNCGDEKHPFICKYVLDRCYNNTSCGPNGECINLPFKKTFTCRCRLFYDGKKCEMWSVQGIQMLIAVGLVIFGFVVVLFIKLFHNVKLRCGCSSSSSSSHNKSFHVENYFKRSEIDNQLATGGDGDHPALLGTNGTGKKRHNKHDKRYSVITLRLSAIKLVFAYALKKRRVLILVTLALLTAMALILLVSLVRYRMIAYRIERFNQIYRTNPNQVDIDDIDKQQLEQQQPNNSSSSASYYLNRLVSYDLCSSLKDQFLEDYIIVYVAILLTLVIYVRNMFMCGHKQKQHTTTPSSSRWPKWLTCCCCCCCCSCRLELPIPLSPFSKRNRFFTGVIYAAYTYNILKIFEYLLVGGDSTRQIVDNTKQFFDSAVNLTQQPGGLGRVVVDRLASVNLTLVKERATQASAKLFAYAERGILVDLLKQICSVLIIGLRYYPILLCVELKRKSKLCYFLCAVYVLALLAYYVYMNIFCLLSAMEAIKDAHNLKASARLNLSQLIVKPAINKARNFVPFLRKNATSTAATGASSLSSTAASMVAATTTASRLLTRQKRDNEFVDIERQLQLFDELQGRVTYAPPLPLPLPTRSAVSGGNSSGAPASSSSSVLADRLLAINDAIFYDNIMYEKFIFYGVLCLITYNMFGEFLSLVLRERREAAMRRELRRLQERSTCQCCQKQLLAHSSSSPPAQHAAHEHAAAKSDDELERERQLVIDKYQHRKERHHVNYTRSLLLGPQTAAATRHRKTKSFVKQLLETYVYANRADFRFSKQFLNTNIIAFILIYYITCIIIRKSHRIVSVSSHVLLFLINFLFKMSGSGAENSLFSGAPFSGGGGLNANAQLNAIVDSLFTNVNVIIVTSCLFTTGVYVCQMLLGIRNYKKHVLDAYRGRYTDIPGPGHFSSAKLASSSLHYSGYAIGYLLWGYLIMFEVALVVVTVVRFLVKFYFIAENAAKIVLPILTIFLFKKILVYYLCRWFVVASDVTTTNTDTKNSKNNNNKLSLVNYKLYYLMNHFNFFFDCFLGSFVCFMRMAKSSAAALFFMPRLDYSIFGRRLERTDMGFISYVTFIHMEVEQTHPVKLCFVFMLKEALKANRLRNNNNNNLTSSSSSDGDTRTRPSLWARNRWAVLVTLSNNPQLRRERKKSLYAKFATLIREAESFEQFLERRVVNMFAVFRPNGAGAGASKPKTATAKNAAAAVALTQADKRKSRSTPCLLDIGGHGDDDQVMGDMQPNRTSTLKFSADGKQRPTGHAGKKSVKWPLAAAAAPTSHPSTAIANQTLDTSILTADDDFSHSFNISQLSNNNNNNKNSSRQQQQRSMRAGTSPRRPYLASDEFSSSASSSSSSFDD